jgi:hypothetical protein
MVRIVRFLLWVLIIFLVIAGLAAWLVPGEGKGVSAAARGERLTQFLNNPSDHADWMVKAGQRCWQAPFTVPTDGYIGFIWDDSFRPGHRHSGIDVFGGGQPGETPVYAAADGYLTRLPEWKSSLIIRIPDDPLQPGRTIWTYYTHIAQPDGTSLILPISTRHARGLCVSRNPAWLSGQFLWHAGRANRRAPALLDRAR